VIICCVIPPLTRYNHVKDGEPSAVVERAMKNMGGPSAGS
jgi:hypothetical protein